MKRLCFAALLTAALAAAVAAGSASAAITPAAGQTYCIDGSATFKAPDLYSASIAANIVQNYAGTFTLVQEAVPDSDDVGESVVQEFLDGLNGEDGAYYGDATATVGGGVHHMALGACTVAAAPASVGIFLCYSAFQSTPGVWPKDVAEQLLKQGYWLPYAVPGDTSGGTNLGGFHLTCSIAATQSVSDSYVGGDGTVLGPTYGGTTVGLYPKVG